MRALALAAVLSAFLPHATLADAFEDGARAALAGDYAAAYAHWLPLAVAGDADAQYNLGNLHDRGLGLPEDDVVAMEWYRRAADQGVVEAMVNLGLLHELGRAGVAQDLAAAAAWYERAGAAGNGLAQFKLGEMYSNGLGVPQDFARAAEWYERAVRQDLASAMYRLGTLYAMGQGVELDVGLASELYERAEVTTCMIRGHEYEPLAMKTSRMSVFVGG